MMNIVETDLGPEPSEFSIVTSAQALRGVVRRLAKATGANTQIPSLALIRISAERFTATLSATDLHAFTTATVSVRVLGAGDVAVNARVLADALKTARGDVLLERRGGAIHLRAEGCGSRILPVVEVTDLPVFPQYVGEALLTLGRSECRRLLKRVAHAMSYDETRPHLSGALVERTTSGELRVVATDGHRMAYAVAGTAAATPFSAIIHRRGIEALRGMVAVDGSDIRVHMGPEHVCFVGDDGMVATRAVDVAFPDYRRVIPDTSTSRVTVDRAELLSAVRSVRVKPMWGIHVELDQSLGTVTVSSDDETGHTAAIELPAKFEGNALKRIGVAAQYLDDALNALDDTWATFELQNELDPIKLSSADGTQLVVMPMRV